MDNKDVTPKEARAHATQHSRGLTHATSRRVKFFLWSSMTKERLNHLHLYYHKGRIYAMDLSQIAATVVAVYGPYFGTV